MLKDALENHKKRELKLVRDKKLLLLSISHDIKTPLNAIDLYAKALEQNLYETEQEREAAVIRIQEKAAEINDFVKEIIKSSTEEVISIEVNNSEYYLSELVDKVDAGYSQKCSLNQMMFHIGAYENHLLKGDLDRMYEAVGNLIENAFKYGDGKKLELIFTEEDYCILIHVINSGDLVLDSEMPHLFDSFYRGSNTEGKAGNGLGLYICSEIMKKMQGDIYAKQTEAGMEFVLVCPIS
jgi:K+-sensing histidine kinase KdpD